MFRSLIAGSCLIVSVAAGAQSAPTPSQTQGGYVPQQAALSWPGDPAFPAASSPAFAPGFGVTTNTDVLSRAPKTVRISGELMTRRATHQVQPSFPAGTATEGAVILAVRIGKDGRVRRASVLSGSAALEQASLDAARQWTFQPYLVNGEPVVVETTLKLQGNRNARQ